MNTGFTMEGFPSFGSWTTYALGSENDQLPSFVAIMILVDRSLGKE